MSQEETKESLEEAREEVAETYEIHIRVPGEMRATFKTCAELAHLLGLTPNASLAELMNLFIGWGMTMLKRHWLTRMGYK